MRQARPPTAASAGCSRRRLLRAAPHLQLHRVRLAGGLVVVEDRLPAGVQVLGREELAIVGAVAACRGGGGRGAEQLSRHASSLAGGQRPLAGPRRAEQREGAVRRGGLRAQRRGRWLTLARAVGRREHVQDGAGADRLEAVDVAACRRGRRGAARSTGASAWRARRQLAGCRGGPRAARGLPAPAPCLQPA
jgi:hypothetical protein